MTEQEAINSLKNIIEHWTYRPTEVEAAKMAIDALEKQIPKKAIKTGMEFKAVDVDTKKVVMYECSPCPNCKKWITKLYLYCPHCGQRIKE